MPPLPLDEVIDESINQSINQYTTEPVHSVDLAADALSSLSDEPASHIALENQSHNQPINQSKHLKADVISNSPLFTHEPTHQSTDRTSSHSTQESADREINEASDSSVDASIKPPFPYILVILLCSLNLNEAFQQNCLWPFVPELVRRYNEDGADSSSNSFWAGLLAASFFLSQLISSMPWGILSDKIGRRPVLIFGCMGATAATLAFGLSTTYWTAVASRFLSGLLSGVLGTSKTYTSEELPKCHAAKGLSAIGFSGGLGGIVGPVVGGYLAFPHELYPSVFSKGSLFDRYPVLLPELVSVAVGCVGVLLSFKFLPESQAFLRDQRARHLQEAREKQLANQSINQSSNQSTLLRQPLMNDVEMSVIDSDASNNHSANQISNNQPSDQPANQPTSQSIKPSRLGAMFSVCKRRQVLITTSLYGLLALSFIIFDEMFSFFLEAPINQSGLGFSASQTGTFLSVTGGSLIAFQALIFPWMVEKLGVLETWWLWMKISVPYFLLFPFLSNIQSMLDGGDSWLLYGLIGVCCLIRAGIGASVFTPLFILIGGSCPSSMLGAANGLGQTFAAAARTIGPVIGGGVWSLSLSWGSNHHFAVYVIVVLITVGIMWLGTKLSQHLSWEDDPEQRKEFGLPPLKQDKPVSSNSDMVIHVE